MKTVTIRLSDEAFALLEDVAAEGLESATGAATRLVTERLREHRFQCLIRWCSTPIPELPDSHMCDLHEQITGVMEIGVMFPEPDDDLL